ncbi:pyruvate decarboxylase [Mollisia scopiformis]|uniref:Pyruvate decarboxylase n=1 Tax=Mollisia scopiformis TaxID=149040 RepID=A0A194X0Y1_MOLSC|nr:pyruvate decarboxylase [Mollisia scopiformis]KUJ13629.1 pyruvate decarboxylase [Mollisia scopiformis]
MAATISMGQYLFSRCASLGVQHIFGVPGDFNLSLLDELFKMPNLKWLGACNELNAAYAADGYSRVKGTPGVLVTTYAVGELSAMNGVAGAYAEHAGMIHIVGMPLRQLQKARAMLHHTLEPNMDHCLFVGMAEPIRKTHTILMDESTMAEEMDRVIEEGVKSRLPVYIYVPMDVVSVPLDATRLDVSLNLKIQNPNAELENEVARSTVELIKGSSKPAILADVLAIRHGGRDLVRKLAQLTGFPVHSTPLSKGVIDETNEQFNGLYNGSVSFPGVAAELESSDLIINIGPLLSDSNTGGFTRNISDKQLVLLGHDHCQVQGRKFDSMHFLPVLEQIVAKLEQKPEDYQLSKNKSWKKIETPVLNSSTSGPITQSFMWQRIGCFLKPHDIVLAESGTAQFGMPDASFPADICYITQTFWSSIGYTVGACLGACVAAKEMKRPGRVVLLVGEGSLQMTVQEIGSYIRFGFTPIIFVINNGGYSIERAINGEKQGYNDVSMLWDHQKMLEFLGARDDTGIKGKSFSCKTVEELESVLHDEEFNRAEYIQVCEVFMDQFDYPWRLSTQIQETRERMKKMQLA